MTIIGNQMSGNSEIRKLKWKIRELKLEIEIKPLKLKNYRLRCMVLNFSVLENET